MTTSPQGRDLIESFEGCRLKAYQDIRGIWTIGYGHIQGVQPGDVISFAQADAFLAQDLATAENAVNTFVKVPLSQNQFDALVSFTYNVGAGAFEHSTLLAKLTAGDTQGAAEQFSVWNKASGVVSAGLTRRREAEQALFLKPDSGE